MRLLTLGIILLVGAPLRASDEDPAKTTGDYTVQEQGPLHEAFAKPTEKTAAPPPGVAKAPPPPVPEEPPDQKPQGSNVQWIPGYWAWDPDRKDYLWISGVYRDLPPGRKWQPGYWNKDGDNYRWIGGFWGQAGQLAPEQAAQQPDLTLPEQQLLPQPPASLDVGPSSPPPIDEGSCFYIPGNWLHRGNGYAWQPGYWTTYQPGWVWSPSTYNYTPGGYVYSPGFWDYPLESRGLCFAPIAFNNASYLSPGFTYRPAYALSVGGLFGNLFVGASFGYQYYFGNYCGPRYAAAGYAPCFNYGRQNYDPLCTYYDRYNYRNPSFRTGLQANYVARGQIDPGAIRANAAVAAVTGLRGAKPGIPGLVRPIPDIQRADNLRIARLSPSQVAQEQANGQLLRQAGVNRAQRETTGITNRLAPERFSNTTTKGTGSEVISNRAGMPVLRASEASPQPGKAPAERSATKSEPSSFAGKPGVAPGSRANQGSSLSRGGASLNEGGVLPPRGGSSPEPNRAGNSPRENNRGGLDRPSIESRQAMYPRPGETTSQPRPQRLLPPTQGPRAPTFTQTQPGLSIAPGQNANPQLQYRSSGQPQPRVTSPAPSPRSASPTQSGRTLPPAMPSRSITPPPTRSTPSPAARSAPPGGGSPSRQSFSAPGGSGKPAGGGSGRSAGAAPPSGSRGGGKK